MASTRKEISKDSNQAKPEHLETDTMAIKLPIYIPLPKKEI